MGSDKVNDCYVLSLSLAARATWLAQAGLAAGAKTDLVANWVF